MKFVGFFAMLAGCVGLAGCNFTASPDVTAVVSAICADASAVQSSALRLNANESLALNTIVNDCVLTSGGSDLTQAALATTVIADAIALQQAGIFNNVKFKAEAGPEDRVAFERFSADWVRAENVAKAHGFSPSK